MPPVAVRAHPVRVLSVAPDASSSSGFLRPAARFLLVVAMAAVMVATPGAAQQTQTVLSGLNGPVDFALLPDGSIWTLGYYSGNVTRYDVATGESKVMFHVTPVVDGERGLVGLGVNQETADKGTFFVYYTVADGDEANINRLSRIDDGKETVLLTTTSDVRHNGGRILIMEDGTLFVSTGENDLGAPAQDPDSLLGKVLHIRQDGTPAPGNPHGRAYSIGHRNVYGLAYDPDSGRLFATENGNAERDEVNEILKGHNYGWPECEGRVEYDYVTKDNQKPTSRPCTDPDFTPPLGEFYEKTTVAPTGAAILDGRLYWGSWNQGSIHRLDETGDGTWTDSVVFHYGGRINDLEAGLDGKSLYFSNWTHIVRIPIEAPASAPRLAPASDAGEASFPDASTGGPKITPPGKDDDGDRGSPGASPLAAFVALAASVAMSRRRR
ncbi:MAG TPA: PQQ-dependent sugar dehydrogenase [Candidatus Thermoplasmatota archaeon]|nr:PQQ-dependent sugar dehydrogenase [Candidatus Thermoplasmatota archaeon]